MQILISLINIYGAFSIHWKIQCIASVKKIPCVIPIPLNYLLWYPATGFFRISHSRASLLTLSINCQFGLLVTTKKYSLKCEYANNCNRHYCTPANIYLFKVNNGSKKWRKWRHSGAFIVNYEHIFHLRAVFLLLTLNINVYS